MECETIYWRLKGYHFNTQHINQKFSQHAPLITLRHPILYLHTFYIDQHQWSSSIGWGSTLYEVCLHYIHCKPSFEGKIQWNSSAIEDILIHMLCTSPYQLVSSIERQYTLSEALVVCTQNMSLHFDVERE